MDYDLRSPTRPIATRPRTPGYFMDPQSGAGLLPWSHVDEQMSAARNYWVATAGFDGRPHCMPVWGVWTGTELQFSTSPRSRKAKNLHLNPYATVHLESGESVVVVEGSVVELTQDQHLLAFIEVYNPKYGWSFTLDELRGGGVYSVRAEKAFAWLGSDEQTFGGTATRWLIRR